MIGAIASVSAFQAPERDEFAVLVAVQLADQVIQLVVAPDAVAPRRIFRVNDLLHADDKFVLFIDLMLVGQEIIIVDPVRDARKPARIVDGNARRTVEQFLGVENIVDLGVFEHAVRMDARTRRIERPAGKRRVRRDYVAEFLFEIARDIGDCGEIHAVERADPGAPEADRFNDSVDFSDDDISRLRESDRREAKFLSNAIDFVRGRGYKAYCTCIDCMAVAYAIDNSLIRFEKCRVGIETKDGLTLGMTVRDGRHHHVWQDLEEIEVAVDADYRRFLDMLVSLSIE